MTMSQEKHMSNMWAWRHVHYARCSARMHADAGNRQHKIIQCLLDATKSLCSRTAPARWGVEHQTTAFYSPGGVVARQNDFRATSFEVNCFGFKMESTLGLLQSVFASVGISSCRHHNVTTGAPRHTPSCDVSRPPSFRGLTSYVRSRMHAVHPSMLCDFLSSRFHTVHRVLL